MSVDALNHGNNSLLPRVARGGIVVVAAAKCLHLQPPSNMGFFSNFIIFKKDFVTNKYSKEIKVSLNGTWRW